MPPPTPTNTLPLPALHTLIPPSQILHLFRHNEPRAAYWHQIFTQLWEAAAPSPPIPLHHHHPGDDDVKSMKRQQRAHGKLASLSRIVARAQEKKRAAKKSRKAILGLQQGGGAQGADAAVGTGMRGEEGASASGTTGLVPVGESASEQHGCFVHLEAIEPEHRACTMCKRDYCVEYVDGDRVGEIGFSKFPVKLSCGHLVCFGCARVLIRMYVNCNECGASFGDGRVELTRVEKQIQSLMVENRLAANDVVQLTREDVEGALALLHLTGKIFAMEDIEAGLALLDLQAGTDTTLEDYLLVISRQ